jgi:hypothetical protein
MASIKFIGVTDAERAVSTPADGAYLRTTDTNQLYLGDGSTVGGILVGPGIDVVNIDLDGATDIGADLIDTDLLLVDDGASGTNRKSALSRVWTWLQTKFGTGVATALGINIGSVGAVVANGGSLGTPASGTLTNCTGYPRDLIEAQAPDVVTVTTDATLTKAAHQGKTLYCTTGALALTVDASTDFDAYASCEIVNKTGAVVTITATATVNRIGSKPLTLPASGRATLMREAIADVYLLTGEMA